MRLGMRRWIVAASLLALTASGAGATVPAGQEQPVTVNTLSGAYLAARIAESDNDLDAAIAYYRRALAFDPDNLTVQQSLLLGQISQGQFDEALPFAEKLKETPEVERFSRLALGTDAIRQGRYADADYWFKLSLESDLDRLITGLMAAWAKLGDGRGADALTFLDGLSGPEWYDLFVTYHRALIAERAGEATAAREAYEAAANNLAAAGAAPETYLRALESYAGFLARGGDRDAALAVLDKADSFASGRLTIQALRVRLQDGRAVAPLVPDAAMGLTHGGGTLWALAWLLFVVVYFPIVTRPRADGRPG